MIRRILNIASSNVLTVLAPSDAHTASGADASPSSTRLNTATVVERMVGEMSEWRGRCGMGPNRPIGMAVPRQQSRMANLRCLILCSVLLLISGTPVLAYPARIDFVVMSASEVEGIVPNGLISADDTVLRSRYPYLRKFHVIQVLAPARCDGDRCDTYIIDFRTRTLVARLRATPLVIVDGLGTHRETLVQLDFASVCGKIRIILGERSPAQALRIAGPDAVPATPEDPCAKQ